MKIDIEHNKLQNFQLCNVHVLESIDPAKFKQKQGPWALLLVLRDWTWFTTTKRANYELGGAQSRNPTTHRYQKTRNICIEQQENNKEAMRQRMTQSKHQGSLRYCEIFH